MTGQLKPPYLLVYNRNPYLCSEYSQFLLSFLPQFYASILVHNLVDLEKVKEKITDYRLSAVVFDTQDYPLVDYELSGMAKTFYISQPENRNTVIMALGGEYVG